LQYSTDGGITWQTLGATNSNSSCLGSNWFNFSPINSLGIAGWSGTSLPTVGNCQGTGGSDGWVTAKHSFTNFAGATSVVFRFVFGAGTACNNYNGFAVDDFAITEAVPNTASFLYNCSSSSTVAFTNTSAVCATGYAWSFGDNASASNTSNAENPIHVFSSPGTYQVLLTVTFQNGTVATSNKTITVLNVNIVPVQPIQCFGNGNGQLMANVVGGSGVYNFVWNTTPTQTTATANNLIAGTYSVTVSAANTCTTNANYILTQPNQLLGSLTITNELCKQKNGAISASVTGGVQPYTYNWFNGNTSANLNNLAANFFTLSVTDAKNCKLNLNAVVKDSMNVLTLDLGKDTSFCPGNELELNAGNFNSYVWQDFSNTSTFTVKQTGTYFVKATDVDGCSISDTIKVNVDCSDIYFPSAFSPNKDANRLNETFGPIGNLQALTNFSMQVYGRWGQLIFTTTNPFLKWNGKQNTTDMDVGIYVWMATYSINNKPLQFKKGTVMIMR
jgi:gliding motility-associated-like protein